jgi:hypothetical protein
MGKGLPDKMGIHATKPLNSVNYRYDFGIFANLDQDFIALDVEKNEVVLIEFATYEVMLTCADMPDKFLNVLRLMAERSIFYFIGRESKLSDADFLEQVTLASGGDENRRFYQSLFNLDE